MYVYIYIYRPCYRTWYMVPIFSGSFGPEGTPEIQTQSPNYHPKNVKLPTPALLPQGFQFRTNPRLYRTLLYSSLLYSTLLYHTILHTIVYFTILYYVFSASQALNSCHTWLPGSQDFSVKDLARIYKGPDVLLNAPSLGPRAAGPGVPRKF